MDFLNAFKFNYVFPYCVAPKLRDIHLGRECAFHFSQFFKNLWVVITYTAENEVKCNNTFCVAFSTLYKTSARAYDYSSPRCTVAHHQ